MSQLDWISWPTACTLARQLYRHTSWITSWINFKTSNTSSDKCMCSACDPHEVTHMQWPTWSDPHAVTHMQWPMARWSIYIYYTYISGKVTWCLLNKLLYCQLRWTDLKHSTAFLNRYLLIILFPRQEAILTKPYPMLCIYTVTHNYKINYVEYYIIMSLKVV